MMTKVFLLVGVGLLLQGCNPVGRGDARERNNRIVSQAYEMQEDGDVDGAARLFREALDLYPTMARPHLDLALILHEHQRDYVRAIYHYHRYLELRPGTEKEEMLLLRIQQARVALVASLGGVVEPVVQDASEAVLAEESMDRVRAAEAAAARLQQTVTGLQQERDDARVRAAAAERLLDQQRERILHLEGLLRRLEEQDVAVRVPPVSTAEVGRVRTYEVRANDTLSAIAQRIYGDAHQWLLIQEANREVLGDAAALRIGQVLVIPEVVE